jgi:hypothetical protein
MASLPGAENAKYTTGARGQTLLYVKIQKNLKQFRELDLTIKIIFYAKNLLSPSVVAVENALFLALRQ